MKRIEHALEVVIFNSRWLLAPFYIGLVVGILMLLVKFLQEFLHILPHIFDSSESEVILAILTLVDMSLVANLLIIIIFSGYENFVSKIDTGGHEDRPEWMGKVDFSGLKVKLIASIVAISAIELLKAFVNVSAYTTEQLSWKVGIHAVLISSGVLFALMDKIAEGTAHGKAGKH
ncbi:MAG: TIGR00645 family protein [Gammaproteobacteria bacterium]|nr:TIGR00645 family protein [Gammaproteobacteria bacterium]